MDKLGTFRDFRCAKNVGEANIIEALVDLRDADQLHDDIAIGAFIETAASVIRVFAFGHAWTNFATVEVVHHEVLTHTRHHFVHGDINAFTLTRFAYFVQGCQRCCRCGHPGEVIGGVREGRHRLINITVLDQIAAERLCDGVICRKMGVLLGTKLAEAGKVGDNQFWVMFPQHVIGNAAASKGRAFTGFNENIGGFHELQKRFPAFIFENIQRQGVQVAA